jgi:uncharacterized protein
MSKKYIKHPLEAVKVGQIVKVWVVEVDIKKQRLQLTMIDPADKSEPVQRGNKKNFNNKNNRNNKKTKE